MNKKFRFIRRFFLLLMILLFVIGVVHYFVFPQETRCILVDYSGFHKSGNLYYQGVLPDLKKDSLEQMIQLAEKRTGEFWGKKTVSPKYIYCQTDAEFHVFGGNLIAPALTQRKLGAYIVIHPSGVDLDVISHELCHAELFQRIGFFRTLQIPSWFDEGLAMQVDYRDYFSEERQKMLADSVPEIAPVRELKTGYQFQSGNSKVVSLHYIMAKYEVKKWVSQEKLLEFVQVINEGEGFEKAYGN